MQLLGKSLEDLFVSLPGKKMSVRCVANIGYQMVTILKYVHDKHIIHRDIKPDNFVVGIKDKAHEIFLLDFGLAKKYRSSTTLKHYPMTNNKKLTGTARYASINALRGTEQSRRDDLEAVGYVLMYFLRGSLPWQGLPIKDKEDRYIKIMEKKRDTTAEELCLGFPKEFETYVKYTRGLGYEDNPDYDYLKGLFISVLNNLGYEFDYYYDWNKSPRKDRLLNQKNMENGLNKTDEFQDLTIKKEEAPEHIIEDNKNKNICISKILENDTAKKALLKNSLIPNIDFTRDASEEIKKSQREMQRKPTQNDCEENLQTESKVRTEAKENVEKRSSKTPKKSEPSNKNEASKNLETPKKNDNPTTTADNTAQYQKTGGTPQKKDKKKREKEKNCCLLF